jgi:cellulose biosynthesis protein BcsQ
MDSQNKRAITAISDAQGESFIAASLERQGWEVIYRALAYTELINFFDSINNQDFTLFVDSDFPTLNTNYVNSHWPQINIIILSTFPTNDHDLSEIIRGGSKVISQNWSKLPSIPILTFTSLGRSVGTSTIALNVAAELSEMGSEVLLIDAHLRSPFLSPYLQKFGVNREVARTEFGFSIFEASNEEGFALVEQEMARYQYLLIDLGEIWQPAKAISGVRAEDYAFTWATHFSTDLISISSQPNRTLGEVKKNLREIERLAVKPRLSHIVNFVPNVSPKELSSQAKRAELELSHFTTILPRDDRAATRARAVSATLAQSAPKSALRGEIARYCKGSNWGAR